MPIKYNPYEGDMKWTILQVIRSIVHPFPLSNENLLDERKRLLAFFTNKETKVILLGNVLCVRVPPTFPINSLTSLSLEQVTKDVKKIYTKTQEAYWKSTESRQVSPLLCPIVFIYVPLQITFWSGTETLKCAEVYRGHTSSSNIVRKFCKLKESRLLARASVDLPFVNKEQRMLFKSIMLDKRLPSLKSNQHMNSEFLKIILDEIDQVALYTRSSSSLANTSITVPLLTWEEYRDDRYNDPRIFSECTIEELNGLFILSLIYQELKKYNEEDVVNIFANIFMFFNEKKNWISLAVGNKLGEILTYAFPVFCEFSRPTNQKNKDSCIIFIYYSEKDKCLKYQLQSEGILRKLTHSDFGTNYQSVVQTVRQKMCFKIKTQPYYQDKKSLDAVFLDIFLTRGHLPNKPVLDGIRKLFLEIKAIQKNNGNLIQQQAEYIALYKKRCREEKILSLGIELGMPDSIIESGEIIKLTKDLEVLYLKSNVYSKVEKLHLQFKDSLNRNEEVVSRLEKSLQYQSVKTVILNQFPEEANFMSSEILTDENQVKNLSDSIYRNIAKIRDDYQLTLLTQELEKIKRELPRDKPSVLDEILQELREEIEKKEGMKMPIVAYIRRAYEICASCQLEEKLNAWNRRTYRMTLAPSSPIVMIKAAAAIAYLYQDYFQEFSDFNTHKDCVVFFQHPNNYNKAKALYAHFMADQEYIKQYSITYKKRWYKVVQIEFLDAFLHTDEIEPSRVFNKFEVLTDVLLPSGLVNIEREFVSLAQYEGKRSQSIFITQQLVFRKILGFIQEHFFQDDTFFDNLFWRLRGKFESGKEYYQFLSKFYPHSPFSTSQIQERDKYIKQCEENIKMSMVTGMLYQPMHLITSLGAASPEETWIDSFFWGTFDDIREMLFAALREAPSSSGSVIKTTKEVIQEAIEKLDDTILQGNLSPLFQENEEKIVNYLNEGVFTIGAYPHRQEEGIPTKICEEIFSFINENVACLELRR